MTTLSEHASVSSQLAASITTDAGANQEWTDWATTSLLWKRLNHIYDLLLWNRLKHMYDLLLWNRLKHIYDFSHLVESEALEDICKDKKPLLNLAIN